MKILMIGDVYAQNGRQVLSSALPQIIRDEKIDFVIANGENVTHGKSIIFSHFQFLKDLGVDVVTSGNHIFKQKSVLEYINSTPTLLRPLNMNRYTPGNGYYIAEKKGKKICVLNLIGTSFMEPANNPYETMDDFLNLNLEYDFLIVDFHGEATAEKMAFAWRYDGIITAFAGTHTHVQTADERIFPKGTGYITDLGMTGPFNSVIGANPEQVIYKEQTGLPTKFEPASGVGQFCAVIFEIDDLSKKVQRIKRVFNKLGE